MPFFGQSRGRGLSNIRPRVLKTGDKMGLPWDAYYVLTKADARLTNSRVHPNTGAPNYNIAHNVSDLVADADLDMNGHNIDGCRELTSTNQTLLISAGTSSLSLVGGSVAAFSVGADGIPYWHTSPLPASDSLLNMGSAAKRWNDIFLDNNLSDGTNTLTVANAKTAYDHSQDNTQAHTDYMLNTGDTTTGDYDLTAGNLTTTGNITADNLNIANWDAHITATGASHSYIDQDVTTLGSPTFVDVLATTLTAVASVSTPYITSLGNTVIDTLGTGYLKRSGTSIAAWTSTDFFVYKHFRIRSDTKRLYLGYGYDAYFQYDGTNLLVYPRNVGTGKFKVIGAIASGTLTVTASADNTDVSGVNIMFVNITSNIVLGGLTGGIDGQVLHIIYKGNYTATCKVEDTEGVGDQDFYTHTRLDETVDGGGYTFVCDGSNWYDCSHARHV